MEIRIDRDAEISIHEQLREQIIFLIATGRWLSGKTLPSVRELARRLKIHHNTASRVYRELVDQGWLVRRAGRQMVVRSAEDPSDMLDARDLDGLIDSILRCSREHGYTLKQLHRGLSDRLLEQPPDHILLVARETALRFLLREEIKDQLTVAVEACSPSELSSNRGLMLGAQVVTTPGVIKEVIPLVPRHRPPIPLTFSAATEYLELIGQLRKPSIIAVVSISERFITTARGLLSPLIGKQHVFQELLLSLDNPMDFKAYDLVYCDSFAFRYVKAPKKVQYRLVPPESLKSLSKYLATP